MRNLIVVPVVCALLAVIACGKASSGKSCTSKTDCADGLDCYIIGSQFTCYSKEEGEAACKKSVDCKMNGKCRATQDATHASKPEYMMGGCE
jgi:hypothetical protein